ncbi:MAG: DNA recombination protein RmuC [Bacteroidetes bacterium]|nr:DNA recombination protein RmuC [Bacteroidota bacterium]MBU1678581.1 DNA recombination protein RmuC [Bacteroidota bacterium]
MPSVEFLLIFLIIISILLLSILIFKRVKTVDSSAIADSLKHIFEEKVGVLEKQIKDEFERNRSEFVRQSREHREEISNSFKYFGDQLFERMNDISKMQKDQLESFAQQLNKLTETNEKKFDDLQKKVSDHLKEIQESNSKKLEEMRVTVDEKLHSTLEKRLGESFNVVSAQLKSVYEGLGEMQKLATGVGDLKRVLTNVKARGTWGEVQLERLIEQILTPEQYSKNVKTKKSSNAIVEFAIKLPGSQDDEPVWIPIDAKFPLEDYQKLMDAQDNADVTLIAENSKAIEKRIKQQAKEIQEKYIDPPHTTDFAIMFLPVEGLYAEVLRVPGLFDFIQRENRVTITGPTTFLAVLNSLQMGFRTLAIQKKSSEVWKILGGVKTEFGKFGDMLDKTQKKLLEASNTIDDASKRSRAIERKLRDVQELPAGESELNLLNDGDE